MSIDEAIAILSDIRSQYDCFDEEEEPYYRACSMAIKVLLGIHNFVVSYGGKTNDES